MKHERQSRKERVKCTFSPSTSNMGPISSWLVSDIRIMFLNLNDIFSATQHSAREQSRDFQPVFSFVQLLLQHCSSNILLPRKALCINFKAQTVPATHKNSDKKESRLGSYGNDNCSIIGPCVPHNYYKSLLLLLIKSHLNS